MSQRLPIKEYHGYGESGILWETFPNDWNDWQDYIAEEVRRLPKDYYGPNES